ncbi:MAG: SDR family oxidoreductase [Acidimicrobiia bacterium]|nr:SDR family oxidoreductase [Acidimicrobiia bacterium]
MDLGLGGKKAAITGGSRGIGRAIATRLLDEGASVAVSARGQEGVDEAVSALSERGNIIGQACDAGDPDALKGFIDWAAAELGGLDILICNASGGGGGQSDEKFDQNYQVDMMSLARGVQYAEDYLAASDAGSVLVLGTTAALEQFGPGASSYSAMKAAAIAYAAGLSQNLAPKGIRVNAISPGPIFIENGPWDRIKQGMPEFYDATVAMIPHGRMGTDTEVANVAAFLVSPAASWVTGENVVVDGGFTKRIAF